VLVAAHDDQSPGERGDAPLSAGEVRHSHARCGSVVFFNTKKILSSRFAVRFLQPYEGENGPTRTANREARVHATSSSCAMGLQRQDKGTTPNPILPRTMSQPRPRTELYEAFAILNR